MIDRKRVSLIIVVLCGFVLVPGCNSRNGTNTARTPNPVNVNTASRIDRNAQTNTGGENRENRQNSAPDETGGANQSPEEWPGADGTVFDGKRDPRAHDGQIRYSKLTEPEKFAFIQRRINHISWMIANENYYFNTQEDKKAIETIKFWVDRLQERIGNRGGSNLWSGDLNLMFRRGREYAPTIILAAKKQNVPTIVPLYIAAIETEYTNISRENHAKAAGLFQFIPSTARAYGVSAAERTDVNKMADAAARYIRDRMREFGNDTRSVALSIAGYNRNPDNVRRDLHAVLEMKGIEKERSFWTLIANEDGLVQRFGQTQRKYYSENMAYVPRFFAFAIVGETPWAFGLDLKQALSTCETKAICFD